MHGDGQQHTDYHYLMRHLAFNGNIVATIQNSGTNLARSNQALTFLNFMTNHWEYRDWIDSQNLGLIGHSRGGEAVLTLARRINQLDLPFYDVNAVISLAPTDNNEGGTGDLERLTGTSSEALLVIYGTHDEDVRGYCLSGVQPECGTALVRVKGSGFSLYDRAGSEFSTEIPLPDRVVDKVLLYIRGANHNGWRDTCVHSQVGNLTCATHRELAKSYMNAFLRWQLHGQNIYRHYFSGDYELPIVADQNVIVHTSYQKGDGRRVVDNFQNQSLSTNTLGGLLLRARAIARATLTVEHYGSPSWIYEPTSPHVTHSLVVSWLRGSPVPRLSWIMPDGQTRGRRYRDVRSFDYLSVRAGQVFGSPHNTPSESRDFYVWLRDVSGAESPPVRVSDYADLPYPTEARVSNFQQLLQVASSPMKTVRIPMCRFTGIDLENVRSISFQFSVPGSQRGELILDNLEFTD